METRDATDQQRQQQEEQVGERQEHKQEPRRRRQQEISSQATISLVGHEAADVLSSFACFFNRMQVSPMDGRARHAAVTWFARREPRESAREADGGAGGGRRVAVVPRILHAFNLLIGIDSLD